MGIITSYFSGETGRTDDPDPETGLTSRDRYLIKCTWNLVMKDATGSGVKLFMRFVKNISRDVKAFICRNIHN